MQRKHSKRKPPVTEQGDLRAPRLTRCPRAKYVRAINRQDSTVARAVELQLPAIARATDAIVRALSTGGRLIYVGAGTSGRLAMLDAAECPPTFGVSPRLVIALIAGGRHALTGAVESVEDSAPQGRRDLPARLNITEKDIVVGISASGTTPYVLGALKLAKRRGVVTVSVTSSPGSAITRLAKIGIAPKTGPEIIAGSTRLKAGTSQKMILNLLSTAAMIRLGHVYGHWMIDVAPSNKKAALAGHPHTARSHRLDRS